MANKRLSQLEKVQSMQDTDYIVVIVSGKEYLITKENFSKVISTLTTEQKNKISTILLSGDGTKILTDSGVYKSVNQMFSQNQFDLNDNTGLIEINGYHTHTNTEVLDKFSIVGDTLLFGGEAISSYTLPTATQNTLGGVKVDGTTITISNDGVISGANTYDLPTASNTVLGGVKVDGDTIKINDGIISADVIGNWASGVSYPIGYFVVYNNSLYQCITANSDTTWTESKWSTIGSASSSANITEWASDVEYVIEDLVIYENAIYKCNISHTSETTFDSTKWIGLTGAKGDKGDKGSDGTDGTNGVSPTVTATVTSTGVTINITDVNGIQSVGILNGTNGADGADGKDGEDGKSAYNIAADNGFKGTEEEWLQSLHGVDGETTIVTQKIDKTCTFLVDGWSNTVPYTQTVEVKGMTSALNPRIDVIISDNVAVGKKEEVAFSYFTRVTTSDGSLTAYCYETKPNVDLNIMIEVI